MELFLASPQRIERIPDLRYLEVRTAVGVVGVLPHHADFAALLPGGTLRIVTADGERTIDVGGGFMKVKGGNRIALWVASFKWHDEEMNEGLSPIPSLPEDERSGEFVRRVLSRRAAS